MPRSALPLLLAIPALAGCLLAPQTAPTNAYSRMYAGPTAVNLLNASARPICYVHIAPAGQVDWGDDWLSSSETVPSGTMRQLGVAPGVYNVRFDDCAHSPVQLQNGIDLSGPREILVYEAGSPPAIPPTPGVARIELVAMRPLPPPVVVADAGGGGGWSSSASTASSAPPPPAVAASAPAAPAGPSTYSLTLHNSCSRSVGLFHGTGSSRPPFASGTYGSIGANTTQSFSGFAPETFWITDESRNAVSSFTASGGSQRIEVLSSCSGFAPY